MKSRKLFIVIGILCILSFLIGIYFNKHNEKIVLMYFTLLITTAIATYSLLRMVDSTRYMLSLKGLALSWFNFLKALFIIAVVLYGIENTNDQRSKDILNLILYISYIFIYLYVYYSLFIFMGQTVDQCASGFISKPNSDRYGIFLVIIGIVITSTILALIFLFLPEIVRSLPQGK